MVDYSKWKDIEVIAAHKKKPKQSSWSSLLNSFLQVSDDEDDTHPNIDTPSLFRWRHQARVERMEEWNQEKAAFQSRKIDHQNKLKEMKEKVASGAGDPEALKKALDVLEKQWAELRKEEEAMLVKEKKQPWNVDTISKPGFEKTVINKPAPRPKYDDMTEEEKEKHLKEFIKQNEKLLKQYGMLRKYDDSKRFLMEHNQLVSEDTANYLVIWCIQLEMEEKHELMGHVAHQCICMQYILELSKQLDVDPRSCVSSFFSRIQICDADYKAQFESEIKGFKERIEIRAQQKLKMALEEQEEEELQARVGPGGLDPVEVFESLPEVGLSLKFWILVLNVTEDPKNFLFLSEKTSNWHKKISLSFKKFTDLTRKFPFLEIS